MKTVRYLTNQRHPVGAQAAEAIAFCEANGLDPRKIPAQGSFRIVDDEVIQYREFVEVDDRTGDPVLTAWRETPLVSPPWEHGVASYEEQIP